MNLTFLRRLFSTSWLLLLGVPGLLLAESDVQEQKQRGELLYSRVCQSCHLPQGQGIPGMFPPLAKVDWVVAAKPDRLVRLILHGMAGPVQINGETFVTPAPLMPPQADLSDEQIANILTYIRSAWGNEAAPVKTEQVTRIRAEEQGRTALWTEEELLKISVE